MKSRYMAALMAMTTTAMTTTAMTTTAISLLTPVAPAAAVSRFGQQEVEQSRFVAVAAPYQGGTAHQLLILEQIDDTRPCWQESGANPVIVDPLLLQFDFTGICGRSIDSNGYSIRVNGRDLGLEYNLRIVRRDNDLLLVGAPRDREAQELVIGHANGLTDGFARIALDPGWRFTKRTFNDRTLGHVYLTYEGPIEGLPDLPPTPTVIFPDTANDIYLAEINRAVNVGFISGFEDNTFRPLEPLTREQLVVMVLGAISSVPNAPNIPLTATGNPYSDVTANRWSAVRIQFARDNNIVSGYQDGTFRPTQPVTRAELIAVLRRSAEYIQRLQGQTPNLQGTQPPRTFADTSNHWANDLITQMSAFCNVASPLNETGNNFVPDSPALRNYAAAATLRTLSCLADAPTASR